MAIILDGTLGITSPAGTIGSGTLNSGATTINAATGQGTPLTLTSTDASANTQTVYQGTARTFQIGTGNSGSGFANNLFVYDGTAGATVLQQGRSTYSLALQGASPVAGTGISFPATQNASSDANTLDDYEEGTFTPTASSNTGTITAYTASGYYVKVGRHITITMQISITTAGTAGSVLNFTGLPFNTLNPGFPGAGNRAGGAAWREDAQTGGWYFSYINGGANSGSITSSSNTGVAWANGVTYVSSFVYETSA